MPKRAANLTSGSALASKAARYSPSALSQSPLKIARSPWVTRAAGGGVGVGIGVGVSVAAIASSPASGSTLASVAAASLTVDRLRPMLTLGRLQAKDSRKITKRGTNLLTVSMTVTITQGRNPVNPGTQQTEWTYFSYRQVAYQVRSFFSVDLRRGDGFQTEQLRDGDQGVAFTPQVIDHTRQGFGGVPAAPISVHDDDRAVLGFVLHDAQDVISQVVWDRIGGDDLPLDRVHPMRGDNAQDLVSINPAGQAKEAVLPPGELEQQVLGVQDLGTDRGFVQLIQVGVAPGMVAQLEARVVCQSAGLIRVGAHPIPTHEERRRCLPGNQGFIDPFIESGRVFRFLAQVEGQGDVRQIAAAVGDEVHLDRVEARRFARGRGQRWGAGCGDLSARLAGRGCRSCLRRGKRGNRAGSRCKGRRGCGARRRRYSSRRGGGKVAGQRQGNQHPDQDRPAETVHRGEG